MPNAKKDPLVIDAGLLRHTVELQAQSNAPDATTGEPSQDWATFLTCKAAIRGALSKEMYQAMQFSAQVSHVITIRWPGAGFVIAGGQQLLFGSRVFKLQWVENLLERNRVLLLHCLEINGVAS